MYGKIRFIECDNEKTIVTYFRAEDASKAQQALTNSFKIELQVAQQPVIVKLDNFPKQYDVEDFEDFKKFMKNDL